MKKIFINLIAGNFLQINQHDEKIYRCCFKTIIIYFLTLVISDHLPAQAPTIQWTKCLGGYGVDGVSSIQQTTDGGYIMAGATSSNDGDVSGLHVGYDQDGFPSADMWIIKLNSGGSVVWQKCLGGSGHDYGGSIQQTTDGGYIVAGTTGSNDGDVSGNHGEFDFWVVKLNSGGSIEWQKCLGGSDFDGGASSFNGGYGGETIQQTTDGGYIVAGFTYSNEGDVSGNHSSDRDFWVVKLNSTGGIVWQKCLGGSGDDMAFSIQPSSDGGYIVAGGTTSNDGDVSGNQSSDRDFWVVKLNSTGGIVWQKCFGGSGDDLAFSIQPTSDGGYVVAGGTASNDGDVSGDPGIYDMWVVKLNSTGGLVWQKCLGGSYNDGGPSIQQTTDGGYVVGGYTLSNDGDVSGNHGGFDFWVVKLNSSGSIVWQKCLGGSGWDQAYSIQQTTDGGYIVGGFTGSNDGDASGYHEFWDFWVVKLSGCNNAGVLITTQPQSISICAGSNHTFSVVSSGASTYQWQLSIDGGNTFNSIASATLSTYTIISITTSQHGYQYRCIVMGQCDTIISSNAVLSVADAVSIIADPTDAEVCSGGNASFLVTTMNASTVSYQWEVSTNSGITYSQIVSGGAYSGSTSSVLSIANANESLINNRYRCIVSNSLCNGSMISNSALLIVRRAPTVQLTASPLTSLFPWQTTTLTATPVVSGGQMLPLTWYYDNVVMSAGNNSRIVSFSQTGTYQVQVSERWPSDLVCSNRSNIVTINANTERKLVIYPNPNHGQFRISYYNPSGINDLEVVTVYDAKGARVYRARFTLTGIYTSIDISRLSLSAGFYSVLISDASGKRLTVGKLIVD